MAKVAASSFLLSCLFVLFLSSVSAVTDEDKQVYIVYMGSLSSRAGYTPTSNHMSILQEVTGESSIEGRLVRSYKRSFNGFAARLTGSERERVANMDGVVSVFPNKMLQLQTTTSWDFMGLKEGKRTKRNPTVESDTIIGVIDSGITPESQSFSDEGFGPPPKKWKGVCSGGENFTCNNKLIGARDYTSEGTRDTGGHGTHTASTAAGNAVVDISFFGIGNGTVRGGVPASRIAAYKVCTETGCSSDALLSAFDDAIADGVDLITISIGDKSAPMFERDPIAIGAFHARAKGILTVNSGGNSGSDPTSVSSVAPWILTVAASTTNRGFVTKVVLGNGKTLVGKSVNAFDMKGKKYPLVYGKSAASSDCDAAAAELCQEACLDESRVNGKILVCGGPGGLKIAESVGASGLIFKTPKPDVAFIHPLPASGLQAEDFESLVTYLESTNSPQATILKTESIFNRTSPVSASFSSRGPNTIAADILKPDITAPGVEILAAYSPDSSPTEELDTRHVKFSVMSGTSMACPHVAGVAAYVKTFNPKWSPSMIQSAIMTTAWPMNASGSGFVSTEFAYGSGHVNPKAASHPGLVYKLTKADHIAFLCGLNYTIDDLQTISGENITCTKELSKTLSRNLNYPTMLAKVSGTKPFNITFQRTVTNVGRQNSTYKAKVVTSPGSKLRIKVLPPVLFMKSMNEQKSFMVTVSGDSIGTEQPVSANLIWFDGNHHVRSPIVVYAMS
ncbi:PREDICTED: subtilisin-like protease SBT4.13 isoform X2 [Camelina sativa]|uniref:Subtilisin-like protease SBT4.13 isoform X2 n=1 Tax=Camelina sativa TaxID=90675 RepID=A0ABM1R1L4_CAMSA|nr:PREDICTED: subtilisin-like protease SBT4.13 isoform X2 [Camelina sativa]